MDREFPVLPKKDHLQYFMAYAILAVAYSWQLIQNFDKTGIGDALLQPYYYWWMKTALGMLQNPYYTDYLFFPQGANLAFGFGMVPDAILMLPITILFGANQAVNLSYILGFLLTGYFAFLLCHDLTENKQTAFIGGVIFAFVPYHVVHVPHQIIIANAQLLPLYFFLFRRALLSERKKWSIFAGLAMALLILTDQLQAMLSAFVTGLILVYLAATMLATMKRDSAGWGEFTGAAVKLATMVIVAGAVASIYLVPAVNFMSSSQSALKISPFEHGGANQFGADLLGFIVPPSYHPLWGSLFKTVGNNFYFLGYLPLLLALCGAGKYLRRDVTKIVLTITVITFVLSLGITLKVNGVWEWDGRHVRLAYYYLSNLPPFSLIRTPYRFHLLTTLGISILASLGATYLVRTKSQRVGGIFLSVITVGVILEFAPNFQKYETAGPVPQIYREMAKDKDSYSVLILPLSRWTSLLKNGSGSPSILMYYQTVHGKKIFNGFSSRVSDRSLAFDDAVLDLMKDVSTYDNYEIHVFGKRSATEEELATVKEQATRLAADRGRFLKENNIRYIIIHTPISHQGSMTRLFMETFLGYPMNYDADSGIAYIKIDDFSR